MRHIGRSSKVFFSHHFTRLTHEQRSNANSSGPGGRMLEIGKQPAGVDERRTAALGSVVIGSNGRDRSWPILISTRTTLAHKVFPSIVYIFPFLYIFGALGSHIYIFTPYLGEDFFIFLLIKWRASAIGARRRALPSAYMLLFYRKSVLFEA